MNTKGGYTLVLGTLGVGVLNQVAAIVCHVIVLGRHSGHNHGNDEGSN